MPNVDNMHALCKRWIRPDPLPFPLEQRNVQIGFEWELIKNLNWHVFVMLSTIF